jgi:hypothetical protein
MQVRHAKSPLEFFSKIHSPSPFVLELNAGCIHPMNADGDLTSQSTSVANADPPPPG